MPYNSYILNCSKKATYRLAERCNTQNMNLIRQAIPEKIIWKCYSAPNEKHAQNNYFITLIMGYNQ